MKQSSAEFSRAQHNVGQFSSALYRHLGSALCSAVQSYILGITLKHKAMQYNLLQGNAVHSSVHSVPSGEVQCSAVSSDQCSLVQRSAAQCSAVQCRAVQCNAEQCSAVQCNAVQCSAVQY